MKGSFSEDALAAYQQALAERDGMDYSEGDSYDFTRCVRSDGSFYGTRGKCKSGKDAGAKEEESKDPVAGLRKAERERQAKQGADEKAKNLRDAKKEMKDIADEINNRGPHTKEELADLEQKMKYAANRAKQIESGKLMTREQFQAGLKKMK